jgi:drug/metabolite transporter (DMT)-like permease
LPRHPLFWPYVSLGAVCFFWGTTYLGIRMALESFPPLVLVASRFLLSGSLILIGARLLGYTLPRGRELCITALSGVLPLGVANGALTFSETLIPSSLASLYITTSPFWLVGLEALSGGERLRVKTLLAMLVGFSGTALLLAPGAAGFTANNIKGFLLLQLGNLAWAAGSVLFRRRGQAGATRANPIVGGGIQQLATGLIVGLLLLILPQPPVQWSTRGTLALFYLVTFGSIVGYSAYVYCLDKLPMSMVSTYTYVNPLVAVSLGWLFYREPAGWREFAAMAVIFLGVFLVKRSQRPA